MTKSIYTAEDMRAAIEQAIASALRVYRGENDFDHGAYVGLTELLAAIRALPVAKTDVAGLVERADGILAVLDCFDMPGAAQLVRDAMSALTRLSADLAAAREERDEWRSDLLALQTAIVGETGLSAMTVAAQARLYRPRAEAAKMREERDYARELFQTQGMWAANYRKQLAGAREAALREAAEVCEGIRTRIANGPMPEGARFDYEQAILALIPAPATVQCCMCGKKGLSTEENGGPECELSDGRWVCGPECYDRSQAIYCATCGATEAADLAASQECGVVKEESDE